MDHSRDPCPWVTLSDFGGAFCMGVSIVSSSQWKARLSLTNAFLNYQAIGGSLWHGIKGFRNSPYGERRIGAITAIKARAPVLGGNFGVWGGLFSTYDCAVKGIRKKEDPYNASESIPSTVFGVTSKQAPRMVQRMGDVLISLRSNCRIFYRRFLGHPRGHESSKEWGNHVCYILGRYRRSWHWLSEDDGRTDTTRRE